MNLLKLFKKKKSSIIFPSKGSNISHTLPDKLPEYTTTTTSGNAFIIYPGNHRVEEALEKEFEKQDHINLEEYGNS